MNLYSLSGARSSASGAANVPLAPPGLEPGSPFAETQAVPQLQHVQYWHAPTVPPPPPPPSWHAPVNHPATAYDYPNAPAQVGPRFGPYAPVPSGGISNSNSGMDAYQQWYHAPSPPPDPPRLAGTPSGKRKRQREKRSRQRTRGSAGVPHNSPSPSPSPMHQGRKHAKSKRWKPMNKSKSRSKDPDLFVHPKYFLAAKSVGSSPEDVERWIAERRKKFPSSKREPKVSSPATSKAEKLPCPETSCLVSERVAKCADKVAVEKSTSCSQNTQSIDCKMASVQSHQELKISRRTKKQESASGGKPGCNQPGLCYKFNRGACRRGDSCRYEHNTGARSRCMIESRKKAEKRNYLCLSGREPGKTSLIRKLLLKDIKTEEFVMLAIVQFLCENGFLQSS